MVSKAIMAAKNLQTVVVVVMVVNLKVLLIIIIIINLSRNFPIMDVTRCITS